MARVFLWAIAGVTFAALLTAAAPANAGADNLEPAGARGFLVADDAKVAPHLAVSGLVLESWIKDPVVLRGPDGAIVKTLVGQQWTTSAALTVGLFDRLELSLAAGGAAVQGGSEWEPELVDPRVTLKVLLAETGPLSFAARATAGGPEEWRVEPGVVGTLELPFLITGVDVGARVTTAGATAFTWAAGARVPLFQERISLDADLWGEVAPKTGAWESPVEGAIGATAKLGVVDVFADVGGGLVAGYGTPNVRALAGVRFSFEPARHEEVPAAVVAAKPVLAPPPPPAALTPPAPAPVEAPAPPAAAPPPVTVVVTEATLAFSEDVVLFDVESDKLMQDAYAPLDAVARALAEHPEITKVMIEGHADARGTAEYNQKLSLWRAMVVKRYLVGAGVDAERLAVHAYGKSKPRAPNDTAEGRRENRRVEFNVIERGGK